MTTAEHSARSRGPGPLTDRIVASIQEAMRSYPVPGVVIAVVRDAGQVECLAAGADAIGDRLTSNSLFPVASVTKLATALAVLRLAAAGRLALDDPLARLLPEAAAGQDGVTVRAMLSHTAGLPLDLADGAAPYEQGLDWAALRSACLSTSLAWPPGTRVQYSNIGPGLLAIAAERLTGRPFSEALSDHVLRPLGIEGYLGTEPPRPPARIAGDFGKHLGTPVEPFNSAFWRSLALPWGGLVTSAAGALALVRAFDGVPEGYLPADLLAQARADQTGGLRRGVGDPGSLHAGQPLWPWGLGVELRGHKRPHPAPAAASPASYGHAGASGCLAWSDPEAHVAWALLGTRTIDAWAAGMSAIGSAILAPA